MAVALNYGGVCARIYVARPPRAFSWGWRLLRPFLTEATNAKVLLGTCTDALGGVLTRHTRAHTHTHARTARPSICNYLLPAAHHSSRPTHHAPLTTHHLLLATSYSSRKVAAVSPYLLLTTHNSLLISTLLLKHSRWLSCRRARARRTSRTTTSRHSLR